jgi:WD40 repeat protein
VDKTLRLWDVASGRSLQTTVAHNFPAYCVAFSPDGKVLATGSNDSMLKVWDADGVRELRSARAHVNGVKSVVFTPDGRTIISAGDDASIKFWNAPTLEEQRTLSGHVGNVEALALSPDGKLLVSAGLDKSIRLWDVTLGNSLGNFVGHGDASRALAFSPDGRLLATGSADLTVKLWDAAMRRELSTLSSRPRPINALAFSPDSKILISAGNDARIKVWEFNSGLKLRSFPAHPDNIYCVTYSADGSVLASTGGTNEIKLWDTKTWRELRALSGHDLYVSAVAFSPDSKTLASASNDKTVKVWDAASGRLLQTMTGFSNPVYSVAFSPDGKTLAAGSFDAPVRLWEAGSWHELPSLVGHTDTVRAVRFSPDGRLLATAGNDRTIRLWDTATGQTLHVLSGHTNNIHTIAFSPDGKTLASGGLDATVRLWDVAAGRSLSVLGGHTDRVAALSFSADGRMLASGSADAVIKLWNVERREERLSLVAVEQGDYLAATPDGFYTTSRGAIKGVGFRLSNVAYPFDQFDLRLNRPDVVFERMGNQDSRLISAYHAAYLKRLSRMGYSEASPGQDLQIPELTITSPALPLSTVEHEVTFRIKASDARYPLSRINVWVNNVPASGRLNDEPFAGSQGARLTTAGANTVEAAITVPLSRGSNKIQVSCLNSDLLESLRQTFTITYAPPGPTPKPNLYVIAIGVSKYQQSQHNLNFAADDAKHIYEFYLNNKDRFNRVYGLLLRDEEAKRDDVLDKVRTLLRDAGVDDVVVLFLAGHGMLDDKLNYYFGTYDVDFDDPSKGGLPYEQIESLLDGIGPRKKLLLMDTCHAGEVDKDATRQETTGDDSTPVPLTPGVKAVAARARPGKSYVGLSNSFVLMQELFADLRRGSGTSVIAAASGVQYAYESDGTGLFTHALLDGLRDSKADADGDGSVRISELRDWVFGQVQAMTSGRQTPVSRSENADSDWVVW